MSTDQIIIYQTADGQTAVDVKLLEETVWLTQGQMQKLFNQTKQNISLHINNIFKEGELTSEAVVKESLTTASDGKKYYTRYYELDVIISVGYRVKSQRGTQFRIWANQVLKNYLIKGYAVNEQKLKEKTAQLDALKHTVQLLGSVSRHQELTADEATGLLKVADG